MPKWTQRELDHIYQRSNGRCRECGRHHSRRDYGRAWNVDHILAQKLGGRDELENLAVTCIRCNSRKADGMSLNDLIDVISSKVDREAPVQKRHSNRNSDRGNMGNRGRRGGPSKICPSCKRGRKPAHLPYCNNCFKKSQNMPVRKYEGECKYGRCHEQVETSLFGLVQEDYCPRHMEQHRRGLI